jgi:hypothetical protein
LNQPHGNGHAPAQDADGRDLIGKQGILRQVAFVPLVILILLGAALFAATQSAVLTAALDAAPLSWLVGIQVYRVLGLVFLLAWSRGFLPGYFALPAGIDSQNVPTQRESTNERRIRPKTKRQRNSQHAHKCVSKVGTSTSGYKRSGDPAAAEPLDGAACS